MNEPTPARHATGERAWATERERMLMEQAWDEGYEQSHADGDFYPKRNPYQQRAADVGDESPALPAGVPTIYDNVPGFAEWLETGANESPAPALEVEIDRLRKLAYKLGATTREITGEGL